MQDRLLFPVDAVPAAGPLPPSATALQLPVGDEILHGAWFRPAAKTGRRVSLIIGFGGNAWNGQEVGSALHALFPQAHVVAFHYRGYRPSTGQPSAEALLADAPRIVDFAVEQIRPDQLVVVGFSIGSGVAASLADHPPVSGLILVTPFDSLRAAAADLFPWFPVGPLFRHEMNSADYLRSSPTPVAIIAAGRDTIIRPARTEALRRQVGRLAYDRTVAGAGHNDLYRHAEFAPAMTAAFEAVTSK